MAGKPTVRKAQLSGGNRMIEKQMPAAETQQETGTRWSAPPPAVPHNWPLCQRPLGCGPVTSDPAGRSRAGGGLTL